MTASIEPTRPRDRADVETWVRRGCTLIVAAVAAYSSYEHQREFALRFGADPTNAALWPLSVDGLLLLATVGLVMPGRQFRRMRVAVWSAFPAASLSRWPQTSPKPQPGVATGPGRRVATGRPAAAVELLAHHSRSRHRNETQPASSVTYPASPAAQREPETAHVITLAGLSPTTDRSGERTAQEIMWAHYLQGQQHGRTPTGAELDRVAGTNNYGRTVLRQWREQGRVP